MIASNRIAISNILRFFRHINDLEFARSLCVVYDNPTARISRCVHCEVLDIGESAELKYHPTARPSGSRSEYSLMYDN